MKTNNYKYSRFMHHFEKDEVVCLYHSLLMNTVYCSADLFNNLSELMNNECELPENEEKLFHELFKEHLIVKSDFDEEKLLGVLRKKVFGGVHIYVMVIQMTDYCNLRCKYCFIEGSFSEGYQKKMISFETAKAAIDKFIAIQERQGVSQNVKPSIVFYGGEPLVNWPTVKRCLEYLDSYRSSEGSAPIDAVLITNGTLVNEEIADELKAHNVYVSVSIDGIKEVHDYNRIDENGEGSFDKAVRGYKLLKERGVNLGLASVMAENGVDKSNESFNYFINELKVDGLGFNHVSIIPNLTFYKPEYEEKYADAILKIQDRIQDEKLNIYERRVNHKINCFLHKQLIPADCTGCGQQISVNTEGKIGICQGYVGTGKTFDHSVFEEDFYPHDSEVFKEWSNRSPLNIKECLSCAAVATCGGGCPRNADMINGSIWYPDTAFCHFGKKSLEWMIWKNFKKEKMIW